MVMNDSIVQYFRTRIDEEEALVNEVFGVGITFWKYGRFFFLPREAEHIAAKGSYIKDRTGMLLKRRREVRFKGQNRRRACIISNTRTIKKEDAVLHIRYSNLRPEANAQYDISVAS